MKLIQWVKCTLPWHLLVNGMTRIIMYDDYDGLSCKRFIVDIL